MIPCLSIVRIHKKFGIQIFEIDFVIENKLYLTLFPSLGPQEVGPNTILPLHAPNMRVTHTPNLVEFGQMVSEEIA